LIGSGLDQTEVTIQATVKPLGGRTLPGTFWDRKRLDALLKRTIARTGLPRTIEGVGLGLTTLLATLLLGTVPALAEPGAGDDRLGEGFPLAADLAEPLSLNLEQGDRFGSEQDVRSLAQRPSEQSVLGVIYSENSQWANAGQSPSQTQKTLREQLEKTGVPFRLLPLRTLADATTLNRYSFLFLVNVTELSEAEVVGLENWLQRGGRLLLSGPIATESSQSIRHSLRRTLGVYWETYTDRPQRPRIQASQPWLPPTPFPEVGGGIIIPTRPESQVLVTWQNAQDAAVVATDRLVFLGWSWGEQPETQGIDRAWLAASLDRFNNFPAVPRQESQAQAEQPPRTTTPSPGSRVAATPARVPTRPRPADRPPTNPPVNPSVNPLVNPSGDRSPVSPVLSPLSPQFDPSQEAAPPGLTVRAGDDPIVFLEAVAMRQELTNLLGRFNSANLSVQVAERMEASSGSGSSARVLNAGASDLNPQLEPDLDSEALNKSVADLGFRVPETDLVTTIEKTLKRFPNLVADQNYGLARQEWISARNTLLQRYPDSQALQPEIRAVWLDRGTIVKAGSPEGLKTIFDRLAAAGINVVFFETLNAGYPIYPSEIAPAQNPLTVGWDPLAAAVELAHDRQMELHAWIWTFAAGNRAHNRLIGQPNDYLGPVLSQHPTWINRDNRGGVWSAGKPFFDPANPQVRSYLHSIIAEISDRYEVDGIQLDYIRYPFQDIAGGTTFGYGQAGRERFKQRTGVDPITLHSRHPLWETWQNFRIEQIDTFVAEVGGNLRRNHPEKKLSVDVFAFPTHERLAKLQQNWEAWARRGDVDFVCLMAYAMDTNRFAQLTEPWLNDQDLGGTLILGGIHLLSLPDPSLVLDQVQFLRDQPTAGYVLFATEQFNSPLQTRFRPDPEQRAVLPHRQPLQAVTLRYGALQQEWNWLATQEQFNLSEDHQLAFKTGRDRLEQVLAAASRSPSPQTVERARVELAQFQAEFDTWFRWYEVENSYQVRTWRYRLSVLTILLHYGERMLEQSRPIALGF